MDLIDQEEVLPKFASPPVNSFDESPPPDFLNSMTNDDDDEPIPANEAQQEEDISCSPEVMVDDLLSAPPSNDSLPVFDQQHDEIMINGIDAIGAGIDSNEQGLLDAFGGDNFPVAAPEGDNWVAAEPESSDLLDLAAAVSEEGIQETLSLSDPFPDNDIVEMPVVSGGDEVLVNGEARLEVVSDGDGAFNENQIDGPSNSGTDQQEVAKLQAEEEVRLHVDAEQQEAARLQAEAEEEEEERLQVEAEQQEAARLQAEEEEEERLHLEAEKQEADRLQAEEEERLRVEAEQLEVARLQAEEKEDRLRVEAEQQEAASLQAAEEEEERLHVEAEQLEVARLQAEEEKRFRVEAEQVEVARLQAEEEEDRLRVEAEQQEAASLQAAEEEEERLHVEAEKQEAARLQAEEEERLRVEAEQVEVARLQAEEEEDRLRVETEEEEAASLQAAEEEEERLHVEAEKQEAARLQAEEEGRLREDSEKQESRFQSEEEERLCVEAEEQKGIPSQAEVDEIPLVDGVDHAMEEKEQYDGDVKDNTALQEAEDNNCQLMTREGVGKGEIIVNTYEIVCQNTSAGDQMMAPPPQLDENVEEEISGETLQDKSENFGADQSAPRHAEADSSSNERAVTQTQQSQSEPVVPSVLAELQDSLQHQMTIRAEVEAKLRKIATENDQYKAKLEEYSNMEDKIEETSACLTRTIAEKTHLEQEIEKLRDGRDDLERREAVLSNRLNDSKKKEASKSSVAGRLEEENTDLLTDLRNAKSDLKNVTAQKEKLEHSMDKLKKKCVERVKLSEASLIEERNLNEERKKKMKVFVETKAEELRTAKSGNDELRAELKETSGALSSVRGKLELMTRQYDNASTKNRELAREKNRMKKNSDQLHQLGGSLEMELQKSTQETEEHKNKRLTAKHELMTILRKLEAEQTVSGKLRESIKFTFTPKALSQQQLLDESLQDFESELLKLSRRLGRPLPPSTHSNLRSIEDDNRSNGSGEGAHEYESGKKKANSRSEWDTSRLLSNLENETQRVSKGIMAFNNAVERLNVVLDTSGEKTCVSTLNDMFSVIAAATSEPPQVVNGSVLPTPSLGSYEEEEDGSFAGAPVKKNRSNRGSNEQYGLVNQGL